MGGTRRGVELREREKEREKERVKEYRHIGGIFTGCTRHDPIGDGTGNVVTENLHSSRRRRNASGVL